MEVMRNRGDTAVLGIIFPGIEGFIEDYLHSLERQTCQQFDLIIVNDGFTNFRNIREKYPKLKIEEIIYSGSIAKNREFAINHIRNKKYKYLIFTDADDFFAPNRIAKSLELLQCYDIIINDITTISTKGRKSREHYISKRLENLSIIEGSFILDKNIFGFSNTALRIDCLKGEVVFDENLLAVDWYLYSLLLNQGCKAVFTNETTTFYRLHENNIVGLSDHIDYSNIDKGIDIKCLHYRLLSKLYKDYGNLHNLFMKLKTNMLDDKYKECYLEKMGESTIDNPLWWEGIKLIKE